MTVSNEDRDAAARAIRSTVQGAGYEKPSDDAARDAVDALVAHGWGPNRR